MKHKTRVTDFDLFTRSYIETAFWSSTFEANADGTPAGKETGRQVPFDDMFTERDVDMESLINIQDDCARFQKENAHLLSQWDEEQAGHDFWLTRNGHGAGFWARDLPHKDELSKAAKACGEAYLIPDTDQDGSWVVVVQY